MFRFFVYISAVLGLSACASRPPALPPPTTGLPLSVTGMLQAANIPLEAMGVVVMRVSNGATVMAHQPEVSLQPASTLKPLTSIVGLERLGPSYRGRSELRTKGELVDGELRGDLVLRGMGDPDLDWPAFQRMLQTLRHKGISGIKGDLVLDRQWFQPARLDVGVPPFDETPEFRYNVIPDALLLNTNLLRLELEADDTNLKVGVSPAIERVSVVANMTLVDRACDKWEDGWVLPTPTRANDGVIRIELHGEFPKKCSASTEINVLDRIDFADRLFRALWRNLGGTFSGQTRDSTMADPATLDTRLLTKHQSRTLAEFTRDVNKRSDNPITRLLYLTLGAITIDESASVTALRAEKQVRAWLKQQGIDDDGLVLENGSGLSRVERIRPAQLAAVFRAAYSSKWAPEFLASLPIVGVDGGMEKRLRNSPAAGYARIKTGSLRDVAAVAGYVPCAGNETCIVVAMINSPLVKNGVGRAILDALIDSVARSGP